MRLRYQSLLLMLLAGLLTLSGCGGGGGGGGGTRLTVTGRILRVETHTRPDPPATVTLGGVSGTSDASSGVFTLLNVPADATTMSVTAPAPAQPLTLTLALDATQATNTLGDIFITDDADGYTANARGKVITVVNGVNQAIANALVTMGGKSAVTGTNGEFLLSGLPVGLGSVTGAEIGKVVANGFDPYSIQLSLPLGKGDNDLRSEPFILVNSVGSVPLPPYTIKVTVKIGGAPAAGIPVAIYTQLPGGGNGINLGFGSGDGTGNVYFWVPLGTYNLVSQRNGATQTVSVTLQRLDTPVAAPDINF